MAEYIEREAAIKVLTLHDCDSAGSKMAICDLPPADVAPVVHGRWEYYSTTMMECSNCKRHTARHKFSYCPHCGATMEDKYYL